MLLLLLLLFLLVLVDAASQACQRRWASAPPLCSLPVGGSRRLRPRIRHTRRLRAARSGTVGSSATSALRLSAALGLALTTTRRQSQRARHPWEVWPAAGAVYAAGAACAGRMSCQRNSLRFRPRICKTSSGMTQSRYKIKHARKTITVASSSATVGTSLAGKHQPRERCRSSCRTILLFRRQSWDSSAHLQTNLLTVRTNKTYDPCKKFTCAAANHRLLRSW